LLVSILAFVLSKTLILIEYDNTKIGLYQYEPSHPILPVYYKTKII